MTLSDVLTLVTARLDQLRIQYMVVGSLASAAYGSIRATQDADLIMDLPLARAADLVQIFHNDFYVDRGQVEQAIVGKRSFNLIHLATFFKVDCFILGDSAFMREEFSRRVARRLEVPETSDIWLATAEDTLLSKLVWYREGGGVSENQWRDILGILKTQGTALDGDYLDRWARELGLAELLAVAKGEAGLR